MRVNQIGLPVNLRQIGRHVGGGQAQAGEANMVVWPVAAVIRAVRRALAFVQFRADQHIDDQPVFQIHAPDFARGQGGMPAQLTDDMNRVVAVEHLPIAGNQYAHVMQVMHGPWQGRRDVAQTTGFNQIGQLGGDKQHFLFVRVGTRDRQRCFACRRQPGQGYRGRGLPV